MPRAPEAHTIDVREERGRGGKTGSQISVRTIGKVEFPAAEPGKLRKGGLGSCRQDQVSNVVHLIKMVTFLFLLAKA